MFPILFQLGSFTFSSLGVLVGLGFFIGFFIAWRRLAELGFDEEKIVDAFLFSSLIAFLFSRLFYVLSHFAQFSFSFIKWFFFWRFSGLSLAGAIIGFLIGSLYFAKKEKWDIFRVADELVFSLFPFLILAFLGQFFDGSNLGAETGIFWGVFFPSDMIRRHPVSFLGAILLFVTWIFFLKIERQWRVWKWYKSKKEGLLFFAFLAAFSFVTFLLAFLKPTGLYFVLVERLVGGLLVVVFLSLVYIRSGRKLREDFLLIKAGFLTLRLKYKKGKKL